MWVTEAMNGFGLTVETTRHLCHKVTPFQTIDIYDTAKVGKLMLLDNIIQLTEYDEFAYQEMMAHIPMFAHVNPRRALVIGGGDGGVLRELAKHTSLEEIDICEIDGEVINAVKEFIPSMACGFDDPRVKINIEDGSKYIQRFENYYDVIVVDSTDPGGPGEPLFGEDFYRNMKKSLRDGGIIATQAESIYLLPEVVKHLMGVTRECFKNYGYASILVPTYPTGTIGVCCGSDKYNVKYPVREIPPEMRDNLRYYTSAIHSASFVLPKFGEDLL